MTSHQNTASKPSDGWDHSAALQTAKVGESTRLQMTDEHLALARQTVELFEGTM